MARVDRARPAGAHGRSAPGAGHALRPQAALVPHPARHRDRRLHRGRHDGPARRAAALLEPHHGAARRGRVPDPEVAELQYRPAPAGRAGAQEDHSGPGAAAPRGLAGREAGRARAVGVRQGDERPGQHRPGCAGGGRDPGVLHQHEPRHRHGTHLQRRRGARRRARGGDRRGRGGRALRWPGPDRPAGAARAARPPGRRHAGAAGRASAGRQPRQRRGHPHLAVRGDLRDLALDQRQRDGEGAPRDGQGAGPGDGRVPPHPRALGPAGERLRGLLERLGARDVRRPGRQGESGHVRHLRLLAPGRRHRRDEHHAGRRGRADPRDRPAQGAGRAALPDPRPVRHRGGGAGLLRRPDRRPARVRNGRGGPLRAGRAGHRPALGGRRVAGRIGRYRPVVRHLPGRPRLPAGPGRRPARRVSPAGTRERYNAVMKRHWRLRPAAAVTALAGPMAALLLSCGGDPTGSSRFANRCVAPRAGIDGQGSLADEKAWLRLWTEELYLWYREVPATDPAPFATAVAYFDVLKTSALTPSGNPKDRFHFTIPTAQWLAQSQSGVEVGYGVEWAVLASRPPREVRVGYLYPGTSPPPNVARGAKVLAVDGTDVTSGNPAALNAGLFPATAGENHTFSILDLGTTTPRTLPLTSANVTSTPVQNVKVIPGTTV